eukprot:TRINITY_DN3147_c0_g1_i1.p1 TRINITY_DN3147_c0_g1~~TRINITY_DN3147_c0_g1_i1.p1  ORF type:complete len:423 (-),score=97.04 TRINITY_DN3147_c0_g1_i1:1320-2588(-)
MNYFERLAGADYDTCTPLVLLSSCGGGAQAPPSLLAAAVDAVAAALVKWDAVYFVELAMHGYTFEHFHAFFPLLPLATSAVAKALWWLPASCEASRYAIAGIIFTNACFVLSCVVLYRLSQRVLKNQQLVWLATVLYCLTPANIFMSSIYTESPFALLTLTACLLLSNRMYWGATLVFALASCARGNGIVCCAFLLYEAVDTFFPFATLLRPLPAARWSVRDVALHWSLTLLRCCLIFAPYAAIQLYGASVYCSVVHPPDVDMTWCTNLLPNFYGFIQSYYWNQGFLHYYQAKQVPNFVLAAPAVLLSACGVASYLWNYVWQYLIPSKSELATHHTGFYSAEVLPHIVYWAFLVTFGMMFMHVQVITRFVSSLPALYWFAATVVLSEQRQHRWRIKTYLLLVYFVGYTMVGTLLFSNFYPWT